ncbi:MAG: peptidyl-prolyl cis-trans isomerase, partial [Humidesulfovibrio sp.]|nr:peptidyl-prolyl cis-trans isomerase [Humidesulfovibrio sp.]
EAFPGLQAREVTMPRALLSTTWAEALQNLQPGKLALVAAGRDVFEGLLLLERLPVETLDIAQAYPQVEAVLVDVRLRQAFEAWLSKAVDSSSILVSQRLLHKEDDEDLPPEAPPAEAGQPPGKADQPGDVASGNETG